MSLPRRTLLGAMLAMPALVRAAPPVTIRMSQFKAGDALVLRLAGQADTPYHVEWSEFATGNQMLEAVSAGAIDLAYGSEIPSIFGVLTGAQVKVVGVIRGDVNEQVVLVPAGSSITKLADLRGKRVGYVRATTTHYYLLRMLASAGLTWRDITPVNLSPADGAAAFRAGALDAWAIYSYSVPLAVDAGARVLTTAQGFLSGNYLNIAAPAALADPAKRAAMIDLLVRIGRAYAWIDDHHADYAKAEAAALNVPEAVIRSLVDNVSQPRRLTAPTDADVVSQQQVADVFATAGVLPHPVDVSTLWDRQFGIELGAHLRETT